ncbi:WD40-repeat-containing domain protein [Scenedesmus sp. NREL 46B-D3]|nr:WD40-repeat-containing domain protein [Scenedesmus sp. NREL 46B-D3]
MQLLRTYGTCHDTITAIDWSADGQFLAAASKDLTARVYSLNPIPGWTPPTLAGHKDALVGVFFTTAATQQAAQLAGQQPVVLYTVSKDGALFGWSLNDPTARPAAAAADASGKAADAADAADADAGPEQQQQQQQPPSLAQGSWGLSCKHFFMQRGARLSAVDYHKPSGVLVVGFSNGLFELYQLPEFQVLQTLSVSHERISAAAFNAGGDWLALGCARLGQLLVWEWRSEGYVLRQQGHYFDVSCACYSPDGAIIATGADDSKVKLYQLSSGFCYVTFSEHRAPVSALAFLPRARRCCPPAWMAPCAPSTSCATDPRVVGEDRPAAGRAGGPRGPRVRPGLSPTQPLLASCSWDKTVRTWDVYDSKSQLEVLQHSHDVLALAWRPDGKQLASATLDGQVYFWNAQDAVIEGVIEGRRESGRQAGQRQALCRQPVVRCSLHLTDVQRRRQHAVCRRPQQVRVRVRRG